MRSFAVILALLTFLLPVAARTASAADPTVDSAVVALALLTDPHRLTVLPEDQFRAQLGPALGWLHAARLRDVAPESVIARAFARNGLSGEQARLTREALLRNLARADAWEMFQYPESARALSGGQPAPIPAGIHQGHFAEATVILPEGLAPRDRREFACLVLRADDENPPSPPAGAHRRQHGDMLAHDASAQDPAIRFAGGPFSPPPAGVAIVRQPIPTPLAADPDGDGALPVSYTTRGSNEGGTVSVREEVEFGKEISLAALGGPACRFVLRGVDGAAARFDVAGEAASASMSASVPLSQEEPARGKARVWRIYDHPGELRIFLYEAAAGGGDHTRTVLFEFPASAGR